MELKRKSWINALILDLDNTSDDSEDEDKIDVKDCGTNFADKSRNKLIMKKHRKVANIVKFLQMR